MQEETWSSDSAYSTPKDSPNYSGESNLSSINSSELEDIKKQNEKEGFEILEHSRREKKNQWS